VIDTRHLPGLALLLALAGIPTIIHSYMGTTVEDGLSPAAVPPRLKGLDARPGRHTSAWVQDTYGTSNFIEREYGDNLTLFVARSYDPKGLYHHPENGIAHGDSYDRAVVIRTPERPDVPMFVLDNGDTRRSAYALLYDGKFIEQPIRFQIRNAVSLLIKPKALMTLFFVRGRSSRGGSATAHDVESLLLAAADSFMAQKGSKPR